MFLDKFKLSTNKLPSHVSLSETEVNLLQKKARHNQVIYTESEKKSAENMAGDLQSRMCGSGIDFEENKPYQPGSDSRLINWRTYARTQKLYINMYNEDKRPSKYIILDQRRDMYFGTRKRLKIKLALNFAIYAAFRAINQQQTISAVQILDKPHWHTTYSGLSSTLSFIHRLNTACLEQDEFCKQPALNDILNKLQLRDGAELIIISDFHDINDATISSFYHFSRNHTIECIQILDPIELELPNSGNFKILNNQASQCLHLNCSNKSILSRYKSDIKAKYTQYQKQCLNMGVNYHQYLTSDDIFTD
ncbi:DUF58 domain-containing protein [Beggiatoa alba]|nr:DUF58 domain-containing protein [Beggiatoa alba]